MSRLARRVDRLESFRVNLCLGGVVNDVRLNTVAGGYTLTESRNTACLKELI
jgi:hypothetical protein